MVAEAGAPRRGKIFLGCFFFCISEQKRNRYRGVKRGKEGGDSLQPGALTLTLTAVHAKRARAKHANPNPNLRGREACLRVGVATLNLAAGYGLGDLRVGAFPLTLAPGEGLRAGGKVLTLTLAPARLTRPLGGGTPCLASGDG